ncbi:MAG TPA: ankyrin repeat domain-containing protein [Gammaproteobacteria bacterium]|nr:ankyrin repeat domain-containing protein [Gammaproteobacteria bacterium]
MPLNALQRATLFGNITGYADNILESASVERSKKIEWLQLSISDSKTTMEQVVQVFKEHPELGKGLVESLSVPRVVRNYWQSFLTCIAGDQSVLEGLLKAPPFECNNYNALLVADMWLFENKINAIPEISAIKADLILLREAYLEMTVLTCDEGVYLRIGEVPFNLNQCGPSPYKGEIQKDIKTLIEDRLKQADKHHEKLQKEREEQEKIRNEMGAMVIQTRQEAEKARLAVSEMAEQKTREDFTQTVLSNYRIFEGGAAVSRPVSVSDILSSHKNFSTSSKGSSVKNERLLQMQRGLNNRITAMMLRAIAQMSKEDAELKESKIFLELRVAECCKVLLEVQWAILEEHCGNGANFNAGTINQLYQRELAAAYNRYLQDMVTNWMLNRQGWLSGSDGHQLTKMELVNVSKQFRVKIQDAMQSELKEFNTFQVRSFKEVDKLRSQLQKRKAQQSAKAEQYKQRWDNTSFRLADLAAQCNELRALRSKVQTQIDDDECNLETFNTAITALLKMTNGDLKDFITVDSAGFNLFQYTCWSGNLPLVQELLVRGIQAFALTDAEGNYAIHLAVENESQMTPELLETLRKQPLPDKITNILELKNTRNKKTLLHVAATFGNVTAVQWIVGKLQTGKALNLLDLEVEADGRMTPLHYAAREGQEGVVNFLLTFGAGRAMRMTDNNHPLMLAIKYARQGVAHSFFKHGIWLNPQQTDHLLKMTKSNHISLDSNIAYCLAIPVIEGLNNLARVPGLNPSNSRSVTVEPSAPVLGVDNKASSTSSQSISGILNVPALAVEFEEPSTERVEQPGQKLLFDFNSEARGRAVAAALMPTVTAPTPTVDTDATPENAHVTSPANDRTTATVTL